MAAPALCKAFVLPKKGEPKPCQRKAKDAGYCGVHYASQMLYERELEAIKAKKKDLDDRITRYIEYRKEHPSVWD